MPDLSIREHQLVFTLHAASGSAVLEDISSGTAFTLLPCPYPMQSAVLTDGAILCQYPDWTARYVLENETLKITVTGEGAMTEIAFPGEVGMQESDTLLIPYCAGVAFRADDPAFLLPGGDLMLSSASGLSMAFYGILRENSGLLFAAATPFDAAFRQTERDGLHNFQMIWLPQKGKWGYTRELRMKICQGITDICKAYRRIAAERGLVVTLSEKAKRVPNVRKLLGASDVWLWNDDAMEKLYSENAVYSVPTEETVNTRCRIAEEMKSMGMDRVLWSEFDENTGRREVQHAAGLGFLPTFYDIYTDVIPAEYAHLIPETRRRRCAHRMGCYPDGVVKNADGTMMNAWQLKGTDGVFRDQKRLCEEAVLDCAEHYISEKAGETGMQGWFLDVTFMGNCECYDPRHPTTRTQSVKAKRKLCGILERHGLVSGTEVGTEEACPVICYNEGMLSPSAYRAYDAGRRMTHIYKGAAVDEAITNYMLNPVHRVPLWDLVFHDCMVSYWYWGDSHNCCPELMPLRDTFCMLYGAPPLFSLRAGDWESLKEKILASYQKVTPVVMETAGKEMLSFQYVDGDPMVQHTEFEGGVGVTVDFRTCQVTVERNKQ